MLVKITEFSMGLIERSAEIELHELFGNETLFGERIEISCILSPNDCSSTICYVNGGLSKKFLSVMKEFEYAVLEFDDYIIECSIVPKSEMITIEERMCFFDMRKALSYCMEEDERWWSPNLEGKFMRDLH